MTNEVSVRELLPGTRTEIRILQLVMRAKETGEEVEAYPSSIFDTLPDDTIELNCPTKEQNSFFFAWIFGMNWFLPRRTDL